MELNLLAMLMARNAAKDLDRSKRNLYMFMGGMTPSSNIKDILLPVTLAQKDIANMKKDEAVAQLRKYPKITNSEEDLETWRTNVIDDLVKLVTQTASITDPTEQRDACLRCAENLFRHIFSFPMDFLLPTNITTTNGE